MSDLDNRMSRVEKQLDKIDKYQSIMFQNIVPILKSLTSNRTQLTDELKKQSNYIAKRFDDVDRRLIKIESDMDIVRSELSNVSNWTKTDTEMYELTRSFAYEIPELDDRINKLENIVNQKLKDSN